MFKSIQKIVVVAACLSSVSAFAISDNQWLKAFKTRFKGSRQPTAEFLTSKATWQCLESRIDGTNEIRSFKVLKAGSLVLVENSHDPYETYSFVADSETKSFTAFNSRLGVQMFARETPGSEVLIELTSKDATLRARSTVSFWLKLYGYISCAIE
jgi:hypothetical protein